MKSKDGRIMHQLQVDAPARRRSLGCAVACE
jgi:hypothetical protein